MSIKQVQYLLAYLGYYTAAVDGIWGSQSSAAATRFQQDYGGLITDGIAGEETQNALRQAVAEGMPERKAEESFWDHIRYWSREEFRCRCGGKYCNGFPAEPDRTLVELADDLRAAAGKPGMPLLGYGIHGTPDETTVSRSLSNGCVRMRNKDVEKLYVLVPSGVPVTIRN